MSGVMYKSENRRIIESVYAHLRGLVSEEVYNKEWHLRSSKYNPSDLDISDDEFALVIAATEEGEADKLIAKFPLSDEGIHAAVPVILLVFG